MRTVVTINIFDADRILREALSKQTSSEVVGVIVKSWNQTVFETTEDGQARFADRTHWMRESHSTLPSTPAA